MQVEKAEVGEGGSTHGRGQISLIQVLLDAQERDAWLSPSVLSGVSEALGVPLSRVYHVATFYGAFSLVPRGRHEISVCMGTACHVRGAPGLLERVKRRIGIAPGHTTPDRTYSLRTVNCLGCCALGPVFEMDGEYHSGLSEKELDALLSVRHDEQVSETGHEGGSKGEAIREP